MITDLGNVISRLQGLKNVSGKKVMPGAEFMQDLENVPTDVSGAAYQGPVGPPPPQQPANIPEEDRGGQITPQGYDVRANSVINPEAEQQQAGFWDDFGKNLASYIQQVRPNDQQQQRPISPYETDLAELQMEEGIPEEPQKPGFFSGLSQGLSSLPKTLGAGLSNVPSGIAQGIKAIPQSYTNPEYQPPKVFGQGPAQILANKISPEQPQELSMEKLNQDVQKAAENPWQYAAYGSAREIANHPALQGEFKQITGVDYEPQIAKQISDHELAMQGVEDKLRGINTKLEGTAEGIEQRILTNQTTDSDKYYIGLALAMPLILGGVFGKETGLGALSGGAQGFANVLGQRQKDIRADEAALMDIAKQQTGVQKELAGIGLEKAKLEPFLRKNLPEQPQGHLIGEKEKTWIDPKTGKEVTGVILSPGFVIPKEKIMNPKNKERLEKIADQLAEEKTYVDNINDSTQRMAKILHQIKDKNFAMKALTAYLSDKDPSILAKMTQDIDLDGQKVNAGLALQQEIGFLSNLYAHAQDLGQLDRALQAHMINLIQNPTKTFSTPQNALHEITNIRNLAQKGLVNRASNHGFIPEAVIGSLEESNKEFYGGLNQKEQDKRANEIVKKATKHERTYVK